MMFDTSFITPELDRESQIPEGDIMIFDLQGQTFSFWTKLSLSYLTVLSRYMNVSLKLNSCFLFIIKSFTIILYKSGGSSNKSSFIPFS